MKQNIRQQSIEYQKLLEDVLNNSQLDNSEKYQKISEIISYIQNVLGDMQNNDKKFEKVVFLLGPSGSGKSTLINYIANNDLFYLLFNDKPCLYPKLSNDIAIVGKGEGSTTLIPNIWHADNEDFCKTTFIDCAGEFDSSGTIVEIINEKVRYLLTRHIKSAKILLVTSQDSIGASGSYGELFKNGLEKSAQFLNDIEYLKDSIAMVISHAGRSKGTTKIVKSYLDSVSKNPKIKKYENVFENILSKNLFTTFSKYSDEIEEGEKYNSPKWNINQRENIIKLINSVEFNPIPENFFKQSVSLSTKEQMSEILKVLETRAISVILPLIENTAQDKLIIPTLRLKKFINFFEEVIFNIPSNLSLVNYINLINCNKFFKISISNNIEKLSKEIETVLPFTKKELKWSDCLKFPTIFKDILNEAKSIVYSTKQLFASYIDGIKLKTIGGFIFSKDIKSIFSEYIDVLNKLKQIQGDKDNHNSIYYKDEKKKCIVGTEKQSYVEKVPYTVMEKYKEKVIKLFDKEVEDGKVRKKFFFDGAVENHPKAQELIKQGYYKLHCRYCWGLKLYTFEKQKTKIIQEPREVEIEKERPVIAYRNETKYKEKIIYEDKIIKVFEEEKFNCDLQEINMKKDKLEKNIIALIEQAEKCNNNLKLQLPLNVVEELKIIIHKENESEPIDSNYNCCAELFAQWKLLEYENIFLTDKVEEIEIIGDLN